VWWGHAGKAIRRPRVTEKAVLLQQPSRIRQHPPEEATTDQVHVDVIDFLAGVGPTVQDEPVSLLVDAVFIGGFMTS
jgi:hypothetical protein